MTTRRTTDEALEFILPDDVVSTSAGQTTIDLTALAAIVGNTFPNPVTFEDSITVQNGITADGGIDLTSGPLTISATGTPALIFLGDPQASTTESLIKVGSSLSGGSSSGTYLGINADAGYVGDFARFQVNNATVFSVAGTGALRFGSVNLGTSAGSARAAIVANILTCSVRYADLRAATGEVHYFPFGALSGFFTDMYVTLEGPLADGDVVLTVTLDGNAVPLDTTTVPLAGSVAGRTTKIVATAAAPITALSSVRVLIGGANTANVGATVLCKAVY